MASLLFLAGFLVGGSAGSSLFVTELHAQGLVCSEDLVRQAQDVFQLLTSVTNLEVLNADCAEFPARPDGTRGVAVVLEAEPEVRRFASGPYWGKISVAEVAAEWGPAFTVRRISVTKSREHACQSMASQALPSLSDPTRAHGSPGTQTSPTEEPAPGPGTATGASLPTHRRRRMIPPVGGTEGERASFHVHGAAPGPAPAVAALKPHARAPKPKPASKPKPSPKLSPEPKPTPNPKNASPKPKGKPASAPTGASVAPKSSQGQLAPLDLVPTLPGSGMDQTFPDTTLALASLPSMNKYLRGTICGVDTVSGARTQRLEPLQLASLSPLAEIGPNPNNRAALNGALTEDPPLGALTAQEPWESSRAVGQPGIVSPMLSKAEEQRRKNDISSWFKSTEAQILIGVVVVVVLLLLMLKIYLVYKCVSRQRNRRRKASDSSYEDEGSAEYSVSNSSEPDVDTEGSTVMPNELRTIPEEERDDSDEAERRVWF